MTSPLTYGEVQGFITMLEVACEDAGVNASLELLLSQPDVRRRLAIRACIARFRLAGAPRSLEEAFICLLDDEVAERAYQMIYRCRRD